jgi:hypothetical protein
MRRALAIALLAALVLADRGAAAPAPKPPIVQGSVIGGPTAIRAGVTVTPTVQTFGNAVTAIVSVFADTKWVHPADIRLRTNFAPFARAAPAIEHESKHGRLLERTWRWTLRCLTSACLPDARKSYHRVFQMRPVVVDVLGAHGKVAYAVSAHIPAVKVFSDLSPAIVRDILDHRKINWQYEVAPPAPSYRVSPGLVFWLALALAVLSGAAGLALVARWVLRFRTPYVAAAAGPSSSPLERALALFFWAGGRGDETLQRKALERVAAELPFEVADLSEATREIAWSSELPEDDEVKVISEKAGVLTHPRQGRDA